MRPLLLALALSFALPAPRARAAEWRLVESTLRLDLAESAPDLFLVSSSDDLAPREGALAPTSFRWTAGMILTASAALVAAVLLPVCTVLVWRWSVESRQ